MTDFAKYLPDMSMWVNGHDTAAIWRSWEEEQRLHQLVQQGRYDDDNDGESPDQKAEAKHPHAFIGTCHLDSVMRSERFEFGKASFDKDAGVRMPEDSVPQGAQATFVGLDLGRYMDVCNSPQYRHTHSGTSWTWPMPGPNFPFMTVGFYVPATRSTSSFESSPQHYKTQ